MSCVRQWAVMTDCIQSMEEGNVFTGIFLFTEGVVCFGDSVIRGWCVQRRGGVSKGVSRGCVSGGRVSRGCAEPFSPPPRYGQPTVGKQPTAMNSCLCNILLKLQSNIRRNDSAFVTSKIQYHCPITKKLKDIFGIMIY